MIYYKNISSKTKKFHGVTFKPGEVCGVNNYINAKCMIVVDEPAKKKEKVVETAEVKPLKEVKSDGEDRNK